MAKKTAAKKTVKKAALTAKTTPVAAADDAPKASRKSSQSGIELIITEKPSSAKKIAEALANSKPIKKQQGRVLWWELTHGDKDIVVASAVGHLYGVVESKDGKKGWTYPVFSVHWEPLDKKGSTSQYIAVISKLAKNASEFTIATDYDIEGEVIGYTILQYACKQKNANRMKYSMVTEPALLKSYETKSPSINFGQANAGITRHELDWYYGINLSRALTLAVKAAGAFKILSSGRVQGPALKIIVEKEKEIQAFKPEPYWELSLNTEIEKTPVHAECIKNPFQDEHQAKTYQQGCEGEVVVSAVDAKESQQAPPYPFDLTTLQTESYRSLRINPRETLRIAQDLYTSGYISYPRTSSQVLPEELGFPIILKDLQKQVQYKDLASELLAQKTLKPNNGPKTDPAHPAISPTGVAPKNPSARNAAVYDLIVRRFMATFSTPAIRETQTITLAKGSGEFEARGTHTVTPGWHHFYGRHVKLDEETLPLVSVGEKLTGEILLEQKYTQPPRRYTQASIIKELEKRGLGTKATRAEIVNNLYERGYVEDASMMASELGLVTVSTLDKYVPEILDEQLTKEIEEELEQIREEKLDGEKVLAHAKTHLTKLLANFRSHEKEIGTELKDAERVSQDKRNTVGTCVCGGTLQIRIGKFGRFIGCTSYPKCTITFKIPQKGLLKPTGKVCEHCKHPVVKLGSREYCINTSCPGKPKPETPQSRICPKCGKELMLRNSFYGSFWGCSSYPSCRYKEVSRAVEEGKEEETS